MHIADSYWGEWVGRLARKKTGAQQAGARRGLLHPVSTESVIAPLLDR